MKINLACRYALAVCITTVLSTTIFASTRPPAGIVISAYHADASRNGKTFQTIQRRSPLFANHIIRTQSDGIANLRFNDGFLLKIRQNSTVGIKKYTYSKRNHRGKLQLDLDNSANIFFVSGKIPSRHIRINTELGVVGIRGSAVNVNQTSSRSLYIATVEGRTKYCCKHCHLKTAHDTNPNRPQCVEAKKGELLYQNPQGGITKQNIPPEIMERLEKQKTDLETSTTTQETTTPTEENDQPHHGHALTHTHSLTNNSNLASTTATASGATEENTSSPGGASHGGFALVKAS